MQDAVKGSFPSAHGFLQHRDDKLWQPSQAIDECSDTGLKTTPRDLNPCGSSAWNIAQTSATLFGDSQAYKRASVGVPYLNSTLREPDLRHSIQGAINLCACYALQ